MGIHAGLGLNAQNLRPASGVVCNFDFIHHHGFLLVVLKHLHYTTKLTSCQWGSSIFSVKLLIGHEAVLDRLKQPNHPWDISFREYEIE